MRSNRTTMSICGVSSFRLWAKLGLAIISLCMRERIVATSWRERDGDGGEKDEEQEQWEGKREGWR